MECMYVYMHVCIHIYIYVDNWAFKRETMKHGKIKSQILVGTTVSGGLSSAHLDVSENGGCTLPSIYANFNENDDTPLYQL